MSPIDFLDHSTSYWLALEGVNQRLADNLAKAQDDLCKIRDVLDAGIVLASDPEERSQDTKPDEFIWMSSIFSGGYSESMWEAIKAAENKNGLRNALFTVCCRLQDFEAQVNRRFEHLEEGKSERG